MTSEYTIKNQRRKELRQRGPAGRDAKRLRSMSGGAFGNDDPEAFNARVVGTSGSPKVKPSPDKLAEAREEGWS